MAYKANIVVGGVVYEMPEVSTEQYLEYLDIREPITEKTLYNRADFYAMADALVMLYGNQFTREQLLAPDGLKPGKVMVEFSMLDAVLMSQVDESVAEVKKNFTSGALSMTK